MCKCTQKNRTNYGAVFRVCGDFDLCEHKIAPNIFLILSAMFVFCRVLGFSVILFL